MRIYNVQLAAGEKEYVENEQLDMLKQQYVEYLEEQKLISEPRLLELIKTGRVRVVNYVGLLENE